jgi:hypothetical protein
LIDACNRQASLYGLNDCKYYLVSWMNERQLDPFNVFRRRLRQQICVCDKAVFADVAHPNCLLHHFFKGSANSHHLPHRLHCAAKLALNKLKL